MREDVDYNALKYHERGRAGKTEVVPTKPVGNHEEIALAYTPGAASPAIGISREHWNAYKYTNKGNLVAVISNGSSLMGLGDRGAIASKPLLEGKAMLFKVLADIDAFDIELSEEEPDKIVETIQAMAPTFGAISLEGIKAPHCFYVEERLHNLLGIPIINDDTHSIAIIVAAALPNALKIAGKSIESIRIVICGTECAVKRTWHTLLRHNIDKEQITMLIDKETNVADNSSATVEPSKDVNTIKRRLDNAANGADILIILSSINIPTADTIATMAQSPIIFIQANLGGNHLTTLSKARPDAIIATTYNDSVNSINNIIVSPYLFRGALDTLSTCINESMEDAAIEALAPLAQESNKAILPQANDKRLLTTLTCAIAKAAIESGVARRTINDWKHYRRELLTRIDREYKFGSAREHRHKSSNLRRRYQMPLHKL